MRKYNRGVTIIEILLSVCIIGIVLLLLFNMLLQVRNEDKNNNIQSNFIINQSTFIKIIEEDIANYGIKAISECKSQEANINDGTIATGNEQDYKCIRIEYGADYLKDNVGFLLIYKYYTKYEIEDESYKGKEPKWIIKYARGYYKQCPDGDPVLSSWKEEISIMKEMPAEIDLNEEPYVIYTAQQTGINAGSLVLPIKTLEGEHYDINLGFTFQGNNNFKCEYITGDTLTQAPTKLKCDCRSSAALCNKTKIQNYRYQCKATSVKQQ